MIRKMRKADVLPCVAIVKENWSTQAALRFHEEVKHAFKPDLKWPPEYFVYESSQGKVIGFAGMMPSWIMHNVWDLIWINVKKNYQGLGIGDTLTRYRISEIQHRGGAVIQLMTQQNVFFGKLGFHTTHKYDGGWYHMVIQLRELVI